MKLFKIVGNLLSLLYIINLPSKVFSVKEFHNFQLNFANEGKANTMELSFKLENNIEIGSYLRLVLPQSLGPSSTCQYLAIQSQTCRPDPLDDFLDCTISASTIPADTNAYFINQFKDSSSNTIELPNDKSYILKIVSNTPFTHQTQSQKPIELYTVSSNEANFIVQESNKAFANLHIVQPTLASSNIASWVHTANAKLPQGQTLDFTFTVTPTMEKSYATMVQIDEYDFTFEQDSCTSTTEDGETYTCRLLAKNRMHIRLNSEMTIGRSYTFTLRVNTPRYAVTRSVSFYLLQGYSNYIREFHTVPSAHELTTESVAFTNQKLKLAWGLEISGQSAPSNMFGIYKNDALDTGTYNTFQFEFEVSSSMFQQKYQLRLYTGRNTKILQNSLKHNLPAFNSETIVCKIEDIPPPHPLTTPNEQALVCDNIDSLVAGTVYQIALKVSFLNAFDNFASNGLHFGLIGLHPVFNTGVHPVSSIDQNNAYALTNIKFATNLIKYSNNYQGVHTKANAPAPISSTNDGIKFIGTGTQQRLEFDLSLSDTDFNTINNSGGVDIYTNLAYAGPKSGHTFTNADCYSRDLSVHTGDLCLVRERQEFASSATSLNIRYSVTSQVQAQSVFTHASVNRKFGVQNIEIFRESSMFADQSFDFFVGLVNTGLSSDSDTTADLTYQNTFLLNSYTIKDTALTDIKVAVSNFWMHTSARVTGDEFPTIIRILGFLTAGEIPNVNNKLVVLTDELDTFQPLETSQGDVACQSDSTTQALQQIKCTKQEGITSPNQHQFLPRIIIDADLSQATTASKFEIVIPVSTRNNKNQFSIRLATINAAGDYSYFSQIYNFDFSSYSPQASLEYMNREQFPGVSGQNYAFDTKGPGPNPIKVGSTSNTFFNFYHTVQAGQFTPNTPTDLGASFTFTGHWNFYKDPTFAIDQGAAAGSLGTNNEDKCITFAYKYPSDASYPQRYNLYCPVTAAPTHTPSGTNIIPVTAFTFPHTEGTQIPNCYSTLSNNDGYIRKYHRFHNTHLIPNDLTMDSNSISFDLYFSQKQLKPTIAFQTPNGLPKTFMIRLISQDGPFNFNIDERIVCRLKDTNNNIIPLESLNGGCKMYYQQETIQIEIDILDPLPLPAGRYQIQLGGVDVLDFPKTYQRFNFQTLTKYGTLIDQTPTPQKLYYSFVKEVSSLKISDPKFLIQHKGARSIFSFKLEILNRNIYDDEKLTLDLDSFNHDNQNYVLELKIKDLQNNLAYSNVWKNSYTLSGQTALKEITLTPKKDILKKQQSYLIEFHNLYVPNYDYEYGISAYLKTIHDTIILSHTNVVYPRKPSLPKMPLPSLILQKKQKNNIGSHSDLHFTIKPKVQALNVNSFIYINFPHYYPDNFGAHDPYCEIQNIFTRCEFVNSRMLTVRDIPLEIPVGQKFDLIISGLPISNYAQISTFFVALDDDKDPSEVKEYGEVEDILPFNPPSLPGGSLANQLSTILIEDYSISTKTWIVQSNYNFKFEIKENGISANSKLTIQFPREWIDKHQKKSPITCSFEGTLLSSCTFFGHQISFTIPSALVAGQSYQFGINGFRNPHYTECFSQQAIITLQEENTEEKLFARSYLQMTNIGVIQFHKSNTNPRLWKWQTLNHGVKQGTDLLVDQGRFLTVNRGSYSQRLRLSLANDKRLNRDVEVKFAESLNDLIYFKLNPETVKLTTGEYFIDVRIGVLPNVTHGEYPIYFDTQQTGGIYYDQPPSIRILVTEDKVEIPTPNFSNVKLPVSGFSLPIVINMDKFPPYNKLIVESQIPIFPDLRLDYGYVSDYNFKVETPLLSVFLKSDELPTVDDRTTKLQLSLTEQDAQYFQFATQELSIELSDTVPAIPQFQIELADIQETSLGISVSSTEMVVVYYQVTLDESLIFHNLFSTKESIRKLHQYDIDDTDQLQYGRFIIDHNNLGPGTLTKIDIGGEQRYDPTFYVPNLLSNRSYRISFWVEDLQFNVYNKTAETFTTKNNEDFFFKVKIDSEQTLQDQHLNAVACALCHTFQYPYKKVRSTKEILCDQESLGQISAPASGKSSHYFYFYPFREVKTVQRSGIFFEVDDLKQNQNLNTYLTAINNEISNYNLGALSKIEFVNEVQLNRPIFKSPGTIEATPESISIKGLQLHKNGIVWAVIEKLELTIKRNVIYVDDPSFLQVRNGLLATGKEAMAKGFAVQSLDSDTMDFSFEGLKDDSHYRIIFYAQSEDPSDYKVVSLLFSLETDTPLLSIIIRFSMLLFSLFLILF